LQARISSDLTYANAALVASFDITAVISGAPLHFDKLLVYYILPITVLEIMQTDRTIRRTIIGW
jgi:hypothetical protein